MFRTLGAKLAAPFALFLLPIAFLLYFLVSSQERSVATARNEMSGLPSINAALDLASAIVGWTDSATSEAVHERAIEAAEVFEREPKAWPQNQHAIASLGSAAVMARSLPQRQALLPFETVDALSMLDNMIKAIGEASELILDPELDSYYLMDILVNKQPRLLKQLALLRSDDADAKVTGLRHDMLALKRNQHGRALEAPIADLQQARRALVRYARDPSAMASVDQSLNRYVQSLQALQQQFRSEDMEQLARSAYPVALAAGREMRAQVSSELARLLEVRITHDTAARNHQIMFALMMFASAAGAMVALLRILFIRPLRDLTQAMLSLAGGNVDIQLSAARHGDEVGAMSRAVLVFKENAIRKQALERRAREDAAVIAVNAATLQRAEYIAGMGNWRHDFATKATTASPALFDVLGFDPAGGTPRFSAVMAQTDEADRDLLPQLLNDGLQSAQAVEGVVRYHHPVRGRCFLRVIIETETDTGGWPVSLVGVVHDITAFKANEINLAARSEALAEAQAMGRIGNWSWRLGDSHVTWSAEVFQLLKLDVMPKGPTRSDVLARCIGEGGRAMLDAEAEVMRTRGVKAVDITMRRGDGSHADFTVTSKAELNAQGAVIGVFGAIQDISERKNAERELEKLAYYDPLSGLANRALFQRAIRRAVENCSRDKRGGALLMLDLDRFKEVNDSLGHQAGDELLVKVAERLSRILTEKAFLARLGGDEFAAILSDCDEAEAGGIAQAIIYALCEPIRLSMGEVSIGTSIGIALMPKDGATADELMGHADLALYRAKESGRACAEFFSPEFSEIAQDKIRLARDLSLAIGNDEGLYLVYQPQVDLASGGVSGFEALVRWQHPERGNIPPSDFVPIAESSKLICDLGLWVVRAACAQLKAWRDEGQPLREVAVNVSAAQFWHSDLENDIEMVLMESDIPPSLLCIEMTESVFAREAEGRVRKALDHLRQIGVKLALDDFGTGYSSLAYLNRFPFDKLKIDRTFIDHVDQEPERLKLLQGIVSMSKALGKRTIAEGAERMEEVHILRSLGCDLVQGYVFSRPLRPEHVPAKVVELEGSILDRSEAAA